LEYSGLTTDERWDDSWGVDDEESRKARQEELKAPARQTFTLHCYIREGPEAISGGDDSRFSEQFMGLPTSKQVERCVVHRYHVGPTHEISLASSKSAWPCPQNAGNHASQSGCTSSTT